jgi:proline dehydrogenase
MRTSNDVDSLQTRKSRTRICKGGYAEAKEHLVDGASIDRDAISPHFVRRVSTSIQTGSFISTATHDPLLIDVLTNWL